jgi:hypothetical protein
MSGPGALQDPILGTGQRSQRDDVRRRVEELRAADALKYPRMKKAEFSLTCAKFIENFAGIKPEESIEEKNITIRGKFLDARRKLISKDDREIVLFANSGIKARVHRYCAGWL